MVGYGMLLGFTPGAPEMMAPSVTHVGFVLNHMRALALSGDTHGGKEAITHDHCTISMPSLCHHGTITVRVATAP